jgi:hypothetical protein
VCYLTRTTHVLATYNSTYVCRKPGRKSRRAFLLLKNVPLSAEGKSMQFQKDQSGKAVSAGRAIVQVRAHDRLEERGSGGPGLGTQPGFPVFSLFGSDIFGGIPGFTGLFAGFPIRPPPFTGIYRGTPLDCTPWVRYRSARIKARRTPSFICTSSRSRRHRSALCLENGRRFMIAFAVNARHGAPVPSQTWPRK